MIKVFHNVRCGKSRTCLAVLTSNNIDFEVVNYLQEAPTFQELEAILLKLNYKPIDLIRQKEKIWIENFKGTEMTDEAIIQAMVQYPILIERPIVIDRNKAIVGRNEKLLQDFLAI
ncbi:arsenate reductase [Flavobacterium sp. K77]|uniref:Arsenate reductase n=1 Tax=Flavobacterium turcicum TaxID=2764718 RepID=A0ABR7JDR0_9FLAO|nr:MULTISPECIES: ArsC/Spx/MgsR family protein [Flavobacterium]MBC5862623.1 arsenate reductase [Flavobacterium turcicum]MCF6141917.1 arsenate reductase [Flavobacterium sp. K77]NHL01355.1 arsenate reductase [Flavobacterium turcicum]